MNAPADLPEQTVQVLRRGTRIPAQNEDNGYFQCWYPIALSSEVGVGQVISKEFLNGRIAVFRGQSGQVNVLSAWCRHLGADLALGSVVGDELRCVYHHWSYDGSGACTRTAGGDAPPANARLFRFPVVEKYGLVWAFNGETPLYEAPDFGVPESDLVFQVKQREILNCETYVPFSNALDLQHLKVVHQMDVTKLPDHFDTTGLEFEYDIEFVVPMLGPSKQHIRLSGVNAIQITQKFMGRRSYLMSAGRIIPGGKSVIYNFVGTDKGTGKPGEEQMIKAVLQAGDAFGDRLQDEDRPVMNNNSFRQDCFSASDKFLAAYLRFTMNFPRSSIACDMVGQ